LNPGNISVLEDYVKSVDAVAMGPGLGLHLETKQAVKMLVNIVENAGKPLLLDADGLKAFADFKRRLKVPLVLTPHAGEYAILTSTKPAEELKQKAAEVQKAALGLKAVILLKGPVDVISDGNRVKLNLTGNPGMTVGGTGDVLSGVVAALLAQKADPFEAAVAGAYVNGAAGDFVFQERGAYMVASDLIDWIPLVMNDPMGHLKVQRERGEMR
jgi:NAD(P)H-hydrate epimerase